MFQFDAWWMPDGETHLTTLMDTTQRRVEGRLAYQYHKYERAIPYCTHRRGAVDVGAHIGLWSYWMAQTFASLAAFEPSALHRDCWTRNVTASNARLYPYALGAAPTSVGLCVCRDSSGNTRIADDPSHALGDSVEMRTLDSFALSDVDFLKVDCEGYEVFVLEGARETLARCRPVVIVEQKPGTPQRYGQHQRAALALLGGMGAAQLWERGGDFCFSFPRTA